LAATNCLAVKLQLQSQRAVADRVYKGPWDCAKQIVRKQGPLGLWTGFTGSLAFRAQFFWMFGSIEVGYNIDWSDACELIYLQVLMRSFARLKGTPYELGPEMSTFFAGGLGSFVFWAFGISPDNVKKFVLFASPQFTHSCLAAA
jgi:solute carrier family 25 carnitine/acylcarnitine transporter 20/29